MTYNFLRHIEELRNNPDKKGIVEEYEEKYGKITGAIETQVWYIEYVRRFVEKAPRIAIPEKMTREVFDWPLLVGLVASSLSTTKYEFLYHEKKCVRPKEEEPSLSITITGEGRTITKYVDELWSFQILRLFEIYVEEQLQIQSLIAGPDANDASNAIKERERKYEGYDTALLYPSYFSGDLNTKKKSKKDKIVEPELRKKPKKIVYHYTSFNSFFHILTGQSFRFSDTMRLNDKNEIRIYHSLLAEVFKWFSSASDYTLYRPLLERIQKNVKVFLKRECYILSFSNLCDSLDQWFKYGDHCRGVCLGLEEGGWNPRSGLCQVFEEQVNTIKSSSDFIPDTNDYGILNGDMEYSKTVVKNDLMTVIRDYLGTYSDFLAADPHNSLEKFLSQREDLFEKTCKNLVFRLIDLKDSSFESEKESRFCWWINTKNAGLIRKQYSSRGQYGHYISLSFVRLPLKEVWVGPDAPQETKYYVEKLLEECGYKDVMVKRSVIPLNIS